MTSVQHSAQSCAARRGVDGVLDAADESLYPCSNTSNLPEADIPGKLAAERGDAME